MGQVLFDGMFWLYPVMLWDSYIQAVDDETLQSTTLHRATLQMAF